MFFKFTARNAYRDLVRNARRVAISQLSDSEKSVAFKELYTVLQPKLHENEKAITSTPAFAKRCEYWGQRDLASIKPVTTLRNPWLSFKREFEHTLQQPQDVQATLMSKSLMWFFNCEHRDDWLAD
jgi:hypothetical protein